jgi:2-haloalkanoic acid dehalogenase type II
MNSNPWDVVTFDCYGTLIDWRTGIAGAFATAAAGSGCDVAPDAFLDVYASEESAIQREVYRPYRDVLGRAATRVMALLCRAYAGDGSFLASSLGGWRPFPDTNAALSRLHGAGYRLGILSNVDRDLLDATLRHFTVSFDIIVTAEDVRSYKPAHGHFEEARRRIGGARWLHAAQSWFHDVVPCRQLGIPVAWINRAGERATTPDRADCEFATLGGLADWLAPGA